MSPEKIQKFYRKSLGPAAMAEALAAAAAEAEGGGGGGHEGAVGVDGSPASSSGTGGDRERSLSPASGTGPGGLARSPSRLSLTGGAAGAVTHTALPSPRLNRALSAQALVATAQQQAAAAAAAPGSSSPVFSPRLSFVSGDLSRATIHESRLHEEHGVDVDDGSDSGSTVPSVDDADGTHHAHYHHRHGGGQHRHSATGIASSGASVTGSTTGSSAAGRGVGGGSGLTTVPSFKRSMSTMSMSLTQLKNEQIATLRVASTMEGDPEATHRA